MISADRTARGQSASIDFEFDLPHPPQKVWRALTIPEYLAEWLLPVAGLDLAPGTKFTFQAPPVGVWDGVVHCRMLECEPLRKLSYTWVVGEMDTVVTFTLEPTPTGTRLLLHHTGFTPAQKQNFGGARYGWRLMGERLVDLLARSDWPARDGKESR